MATVSGNYKFYFASGFFMAHEASDHLLALYTPVARPLIRDLLYHCCLWPTLTGQKQSGCNHMLVLTQASGKWGFGSRYQTGTAHVKMASSISHEW